MKQDETKEECVPIGGLLTGGLLSNQSSGFNHRNSCKDHAYYSYVAESNWLHLIN
jgi:hypothetical protein